LATDWNGASPVQLDEEREARDIRGVFLLTLDGSACGPVIVPVFKTGGWQAILSPVGPTPTRFRHLYSAP